VTGQLFDPEDKLDIAEWTTYDSDCSPMAEPESEELPLVSTQSASSLFESLA
jgi:hypothetical protein